MVTPVTPIAIVPLLPQHASAVLAIYAEGIASRNATFETEVPTWAQFDAARLPAPRLLAMRDGIVMGWAALSPVSSRACYRGVAEFSIYLARQAQGQGLGSLLLQALIAASEEAGIWTLQGTIFAENTTSCRLVEKHGFRLVGRRERIAQLDGRWRDTVIYERRSASAAFS